MSCGWEESKFGVLAGVDRIEKILAAVERIEAEHGRIAAKLADLAESVDEARYETRQLAEQFRDAEVSRRLDLVTEAVFSQQPDISKLKQEARRLDARVTLLEVPPPDLSTPDDESNGSGGHA